jgi:hypothetical protein
LDEAENSRAIASQLEPVLVPSPNRSQTKQQYIWLELISHEALPKLEDEGIVTDVE